jgi:hypothetical protein
MARIFSCSRITILCGIKELDEEEAWLKNLNRKTGASRTLVLKKTP